MLTLDYGLILTSNKDAFIVGADITGISCLFAKPEAELDEWLRFANSNPLLQHLHLNSSDDAWPCPGGGCECVPLTDFRIGDKTTSIGLPETKLWHQSPAFGGCVRLPRVIGAGQARWKLSRKAKHARQMKRLKLPLGCGIVETDQLLESAINTVSLGNNEKRTDWQLRRNKSKHHAALSKSKRR